MRKTSGLSLLLLIFLSLCLVTFSLLSVSESSADRKLSEKAAQHTTDYYHALSEANEILAKIDDALSGYLKDTASSDTPAKTYLEACASITDLLPDVSWKTHRSRHWDDFFSDYDYRQAEPAVRADRALAGRRR